MSQTTTPVVLTSGQKTKSNKTITKANAACPNPPCNGVVGAIIREIPKSTGGGGPSNMPSYLAASFNVENFEKFLDYVNRNYSFDDTASASTLTRLSELAQAAGLLQTSLAFADAAQQAVNVGSRGSLRLLARVSTVRLNLKPQFISQLPSFDLGPVLQNNDALALQISGLILER